MQAGRLPDRRQYSGAIALLVLFAIGWRESVIVGAERLPEIAASVRIGATDHPLETASLHHFLYRSGDYWDDAEHDSEFFVRRASRTAFVGHDTWIGHGATILPGLTQDVQIPKGATDAAAGQLVARGIVAGALSVPTRYIHAPISMARKSDIAQSVALVTAFLENASRSPIRSG